MADSIANVLSCRDNRQLLAAFCRSETDDDQSLDIKAHLRRCRRCRAEFLRYVARVFFQRQDAARQLAKQADVRLDCGDRESEEICPGGSQSDALDLADSSAAQASRFLDGGTACDTSGTAPRDVTLLLGDDRMPVPKHKGRPPVSSFSKHDLPFALAKCSSIREILGWLYCAAKRSGLKNVRYHFLSERDARLVSVEGVGHRPEIEARLRQGRILRRPTSALLDECDSYVCFHYDRPTVFEIDEAADGLREVDRLGSGIPHFQLNRDHCENVLLSAGNRAWVDLPLAAQSQLVGKLSCDLETTNVASLDARLLYEFWHCAQIAAPYLDALYTAAVNDQLEAIRDQIDMCRHSEELLDYMTRVLARNVFGCRYANLFTTSQDSEGRRLLVLAKTTCPALARYENRKAYRWESSQYLVPWVATNRAGLRLNDLQDHRAREEQCRVYEAAIDWNDPLIDWNRVGNQLAAPILVSGKQVTGVIQLLDKHKRRAREQAAFTDRESTLLDRLGYELIGSRLDSLHTAECVRGLDQCVDWGVRLSSLTTSARSQIPETLADLLQSAVPEHDSRKLYTVCLLDEKRTRLSTLAVRGRLVRQFRREETYQLDQTITSRAIECDQHAVFWNELPRCLQARTSKTVTPHAVCALACGISSIGALVVKSDRYDLSLSQQGPYMERLAAEAARAMVSE